MRIPLSDNRYTTGVMAKTKANIIPSMDKSNLAATKSGIDEILNIDTRDLYHDMCERQGEYVSPSSYTPNASYLPYRRYLVDWLTDIGETFRLHDSTIHVSVLFLDKILRTRDVPKSQWQLLATACLSLAAKYEEAEEHCPHIPDLLRLAKLSNVGHTSLTFREEGELRVLEYLNWTLRAVPAIHILGYYTSFGVLFEGDKWNYQQPIGKVSASLQKFSTFFANMTLQQYEFCQYYPTHLAAAILLASRIAVKVKPHWRPELTELTGYTELDIQDCFTQVWASYSKEFPNHVSTYRSVSPRSVVVTPTATPMRL